MIGTFFVHQSVGTYLFSLLNLHSMKNQCLLLILFMIVLGSCSQSDSATAKPSQAVQAPEGWRTIIREKFTMHYPTDWRLDTSGTLGTKLLLFAPNDDVSANFSENINVMTEKLPSKSITLEQYVDASTAQVEKYISDAKITINESAEVNGRSFHELEYSGKQGENDLAFHQYFTVEKGVAYVVTLTVQKESVEQYKEMGEKIMRTFQLN